MLIIEIALYGYLIIGFFYATFILLFAADVWYLFPINFLFWLPGLLLNIYTETRKPKRII